MPPNDAAHGQQCDYSLPHGDVVLFAVIYVANALNVHPYSLARDIARRPAFMSWVSGNTSAMHYSLMRLFIEKLANKHGVRFDANGFSTPHSPYIRCRGMSPPPIKANPSAL